MPMQLVGLRNAELVAADGTRVALGDVELISFDVDEMDFVTSRELVEEQITSIYRIPAHVRERELLGTWEPWQDEQPAETHIVQAGRNLADVGRMLAGMAQVWGVTPEEAVLSEARADLESILNRYPAGAAPLLRAIESGMINGSTYGELPRGRYEWAACVYGTLARELGIHHTQLRGQLGTPIEGYVGAVRPGQTPATSPVLANLATWTRAFMERQQPEPPPPPRPLPLRVFTELATCLSGWWDRLRSWAARWGGRQAPMPEHPACRSSSLLADALEPSTLEVLRESDRVLAIQRAPLAAALSDQLARHLDAVFLGNEADPLSCAYQPLATLPTPPLFDDSIDRQGWEHPLRLPPHQVLQEGAARASPQN